MVGLGGVLVEVMKDTALALAPIGGREASAMLARLRGSPAFAWRPADSRASISTPSFRWIETVSGIARDTSEIAEMDLNPVVAYEDGLADPRRTIVLGRP